MIALVAFALVCVAVTALWGWHVLAWWFAGSVLVATLWARFRTATQPERESHADFVRRFNAEQSRKPLSAFELRNWQ